jgi:hypothetical protein
MEINTTRDDKVGKQLLSIKSFLIDIDELQKQDDAVELDFSKYLFSPPLLAVFFTAFLERFQQFNSINTTSNSYLSYQYFPDGLKTDEIDNWDDILNQYKTKTYIPIIRFSTSKDEESTIKRNNLLSHVANMIKEITGIPSNYYTAFSYLISELTDNIVDHSKANYGWLSFQYYRSKGYLDLCIADSGIGLLKSYQDYEGEKDYSHITDHLTALDNVIKGESTKHLKERGYGVHTSRELLVKGLNGTFIMLTGNALIANYNLVDIKADYTGTLAMLRIPCKEFNKNFNIYPYVE